MADTLFVQLVWEHNEFNEDFDWQTFMYVSHTAYNLADDPNNNISSVAMLQHRSAMYQEMFQTFLSVLPRVLSPFQFIALSRKWRQLCVKWQTKSSMG